MTPQTVALIQIVGVAAAVVAAAGAIATPFIRDFLMEREELRRRFAVTTEGVGLGRSKVSVTFRPFAPEPTGFEIRAAGPDLWFATAEQVGDPTTIRGSLQAYTLERHRSADLIMKLTPDADHAIYRASFFVAGREGRPASRLSLQLRTSQRSRPIISRKVGACTTI